MITREKIDRINYLSKKSKNTELDEEEKAEQQVLRREYIDFIKKQVVDQLENIEIVDDHEHNHKCDCGHNHHHDHKHVHTDSCGCKKH